MSGKDSVFKRDGVKLVDSPHLVEDWDSWVQSFASIGAWTYDPLSNESWYSQGVLNIYEIKNLNEYQGAQAFYDSKDYDHILNCIQNAIKNGVPWKVEAQIKCKSGNKKWIVFSGERHIAPSGRILLVGILKDISEFKSVAVELKKQESFYRTILDRIPNMVFVKDAKDLRFVIFNRAGEELLGVQNSNLIGKNDYDFFPKEQADAFTQKDREVIQNKKPVLIPEEPIQTPKGERTLKTQKITVFDDSGSPVYLLGISEDITEKKEAERLIEEQRKSLIFSAKMTALSEMAGGVAHEINNPLTIIKGTADVILKKLKSGKFDLSEAESSLDRIKKTVDRIAVIVKGLKEFSREGEDSIVHEVLAQDVIEETLSFCKEKFLSNGLNFEFICPKTASFFGNRVKISQVLLNLLNNAWDAVESVSSPQIRVQVKEDQNNLSFYVSDNGPGVPENIRAKIMQPFFTTKPPGKGTGLGLSISKGIAESFNGSLELVDSELGGATFKLCVQRRKIES